MTLHGTGNFRPSRRAPGRACFRIMGFFHVIATAVLIIHIVAVTSRDKLELCREQSGKEGHFGDVFLLALFLEPSQELGKLNVVLLAASIPKHSHRLHLEHARHGP